MEARGAGGLGRADRGAPQGSSSAAAAALSSSSASNSRLRASKQPACLGEHERVFCDPLNQRALLGVCRVVDAALQGVERKATESRDEQGRLRGQAGRQESVSAAARGAQPQRQGKQLQSRRTRLQHAAAVPVRRNVQAVGGGGVVNELAVLGAQALQSERRGRGRVKGDGGWVGGGGSESGPSCGSGRRAGSRHVASRLTGT